MLQEDMQGFSKGQEHLQMPLSSSQRQSSELCNADNSIAASQPSFIDVRCLLPHTALVRAKAFIDANPCPISPSAAVKAAC